MNTTCEQPRVCGECEGCRKASTAREAQLDAVQEIVEIRIRAHSLSHQGIDDLDFKDFVTELGASIVNALDDTGWLRIDEPGSDV
jgi:hypothetical protein